MKRVHVAAVFFVIGICVGFGAKSIAAKMQPNLSDIHSAKVAAHSATQSKARVIMLGDSLTHWGEWAEWIGPQIANRGIAGDKLSRIEERLEQSLSGSPSVVFITAATNDLYKDAPVGSVFDEYQKIIDKIEKSGAIPIVQSTFRAGSQFKDAGPFNKRVDELNALLLAHCKSKGIIFIDLNASIQDDLRTHDGIHLSSKAYRVWSEIIKSQLRTLSESTGSAYFPH